MQISCAEKIKLKLMVIFLENVTMHYIFMHDFICGWISVIGIRNITFHNKDEVCQVYILTCFISLKNSLNNCNCKFYMSKSKFHNIMGIFLLILFVLKINLKFKLQTIVSHYHLNFRKNFKLF